MTRPKKSEFSYDHMQLLCRTLFRLPENPVFKEIPTDNDPRGYVDLYEGDPEKLYMVMNDSGHRVIFRSLSCSYSGISLILESASTAELSVAVSPFGDGLHIYIFGENDSEWETAPDERVLPTGSDFLEALYEISQERRDHAV